MSITRTSPRPTVVLALVGHSYFMAEHAGSQRTVEVPGGSRVDFKRVGVGA